VTALRNVSELQTNLDNGEVLIHIALVEVPDEEWLRVYNSLAREHDLAAIVFGSGELCELELRLAPTASVAEVAQTMSKAVDLLEQADEAHWSEQTQLRQIEAAANAWYEAFKRNFL
jgi:hypothetical protein